MRSVPRNSAICEYWQLIEPKRHSDLLQSAETDRDLKIDWLLQLRWYAFGAQALGLAYLSLGLGAQIPWSPVLAVAALFVVSNLLLMGGQGRVGGFGAKSIGGILLFDTALLTSILFFTGGPYNPFSILYLIHVTLAALVLGTLWTWILALLSSLCFFALFSFHYDVPTLRGAHDHSMGASETLEFSLHLYGMFAAYVVTAVLLAYFLTKVTRLLKQQREELLLARIERSQHQSLAALANLSAGAAHELGSPLGTIAVAAAELKSILAEAGPEDQSLMREYAKRIHSQAGRCRDILNRMAGRSGLVQGEFPKSVSLRELEEDLLAYVRSVSLPEPQVVYQCSRELEVQVPRNSLLQVLGALVTNAFDATEGQGPVEVVFSSGAMFSCSIRDNGSGIADSDLPYVRMPFYSTKGEGRGMGLGLYLATLFAERFGGELRLQSSEGVGTCAELSLPQPLVEDKIADAA